MVMHCRPVAPRNLHRLCSIPRSKLRAFLAVLGWSDERCDGTALRTLVLALDHRAALVVCGEGDLGGQSRAFRCMTASSSAVTARPGVRLQADRSARPARAGVTFGDGYRSCVEERRIPAPTAHIGVID
jgi:hypothetical protein